MRHIRHCFALAGAGLAILTAAAPAAAYETTIRVRVSPDRLKQCGETFFQTGGSERYRRAKVFVDSRQIGEFDFAAPGDCAKTLEDMVDLPDGGRAVVTIEVGGARMSANADARDRNRIFTMGIFVDHNNGELTQDFAPPRAKGAAAATPPGAWRNTVDLMVAKARRGQCGDRFFQTGGSATYQFARILVGGKEVAKYDFARSEDCARVTTLTHDLPNNGKATYVLEVGPYKMAADINAADRPRRYAMQFFVDQIWSEVTKDPD